MDVIKTGQLIAKRRKELQMTQSELAEKLNVTNRSVSKWETSRCLPDASLWRPLCKLLEITIDELYFGEQKLVEETETKGSSEMVEKTVRQENAVNEGALLEIISFHQTIKKAKTMILGIAMFVVGCLLFIAADVRDLLQTFTDVSLWWARFSTGLMSGVSVALMVIGVIFFFRGLSLYQRKVR